VLLAPGQISVGHERMGRLEGLEVPNPEQRFEHHLEQADGAAGNAAYDGLAWQKGDPGREQVELAGGQADPCRTGGRDKPAPLRSRRRSGE